MIFGVILYLWSVSPLPPEGGLEARVFRRVRLHVSRAFVDFVNARIKEKLE